MKCSRSGWKGESRRHSLARKGVKTAQGQAKPYAFPNRINNELGLKYWHYVEDEGRELTYSNDELNIALGLADEILYNYYDGIENDYTFKEIAEAYNPYLQVWMMIDEGKITMKEVPEWYDSETEFLLHSIHYHAQEKLNKMFPPNKKIKNTALINELGSDFDMRDTYIIDESEVLSRDGFNIKYRTADFIWNGEIVQDLPYEQLEIYRN